VSDTRSARRHAKHRTRTARPPVPRLPHLQELEAWRGLAAFGVLLTHAGFLSGATAGQVLPGFLSRMDMGVAVFFVLSGFLLYRPYATSVSGKTGTPGSRRFFIRRVARIVPAWLAVLVGAVILIPQARSAGTEVWAANLLQLQSLRFEWDLPGLTQLWSLSTEVAFYVCLPVIALLVRRVTRGASPGAHLMAVASLIPMAWVFRLAHHAGLLPDGFTWLRTFPGMLDWFALGMVLAVLMTYQDRWNGVVETIKTSGNALLVMAAGIFWVLTTSIAGPYDLSPSTDWQSTMRHLGSGLVAALLIYPSAVGARTVLTGALQSRPLGYLGKISYAFFLWHLPLMLWLRASLGYDMFGGHFWTTVILTALTTALVSAASWHFLESPILDVARRRT
jgi:peptidoglycan/LPS O-acetylase OafA/YrhL